MAKLQVNKIYHGDCIKLLRESVDIKQHLLFDNTNNTSILKGIKETLKMKNNAYLPNEFSGKLRQWSSTRKHYIKTLSLFSGAGGLDIGFHDAGFHVKSMVEIDHRFAESLKANSGKGRYFKESNIICEDICNFVPDSSDKVDFIIGGPPCQTFSAAGRRAEGVLGTTEKKGQLFEEYVRILKQLSPRGFLFENVYGITGAEGGKAWERIILAFQEVGYKIYHRILDSADYGVPQHRERVFIVGIKEGVFKFPRPLVGPDSYGNDKYISAYDAIKGVKSKEQKKHGLNGRYGYLLEDIPPGLNYSFYTDKMGHPCPIFAWRSKFSDFLYKADPEHCIRTLKAQGGQYTGPFHWDNRVFTVAELKRLQTFPDEYDIVGNRPVAMHQIGNSVPPQLARVLALSILKQVFGVKLPFNLPLLEDSYKLSFRSRKRELTKLYQKKARIAIETISQKISKQFVGIKKYKVNISNDFQLSKNPDGEYDIEFIAEQNNWSINLSSATKRTQKTVFQINVEPKKNTNWGIPISKIIMCSNSLSHSAFTALWKTFELELSEQNLKADIVQLCGYYQYNPSFMCKMKLPDKIIRQNKDWEIIQKVVSGFDTREVLGISDFSDIWEVSKEEVLEYAIMLKKAGYEVRNSCTNPQIKEGCLLVPYAFPTLNPQSVQLRKSLEAVYV
jgi:DNA (cytosine-5)-methyltransferase 1